MSETPNHRKELEAIVLVMALVLYGSLYPFVLVPHEAAWSDWRALLLEPMARTSITDVVGNVLLFMPYGVLLARPYFKPAVIRWLLIGSVFALGVQYLQFWIASREPSGTDALFNVVGILAGLLSGGVIGRPIHLLTHARLERPHFLHLATGLMALWLLYRWFPLVPAADWQNVKNGLKPLLDWSVLSAFDVWRNFAGWVVFFWLGRYSILQGLSLWRFALICLCILLAQPLFTNNAMRPAHVLGLLTALLLFPRLEKTSWATLLLTLVLGSSIVLSALSPFAIGPRHPFEWVPFAGMLTGDMWWNVASLVERLYAYGSLLFLLRQLGLSRLVVLCYVGLSLFALEWAQQWLPGRTPEITDTLLVLVMARLLDRMLPPTAAARSRSVSAS